MRRPNPPLLLLVLIAAPVVAFGTAGAQDMARLESVEITGHLIDDKARLLRFLEIRPGSVFNAETQKRIGEDLHRLGYRVVSEIQDPGKEGVKLKLELKPERVARKIAVHGNWPLFDDEILRHLTVQSGMPLPPDEELQAFLDEEAGRVGKFLERDGYFGGSVKIIPRKNKSREDWIDLDVNLDLGSWYKLAAVAAEGNKSISTLELSDAFEHCCLRWGRFSVARMREDARAAEKTLRDRGFPSARVTPDFNFARDADPKTRRIRLPVKVVEKRKVKVNFIGNRSVNDKDLRDVLTIFNSGAYDEIELVESARAVQRLYQQRGYFETKVNFQRRRAKDDKDLEEVSFLVEEGPELKVRGIDFASESGAQLSFQQDMLRTRTGIETKLFPKLGAIGLGEGGFVTNLQLEQDVARVSEWYKARGYPLVKVRVEVARDPASFGALGALGAEAAGGSDGKNDIYVRFYVDEGRRERVEHVEVAFKGQHNKSEKDILRVLRLVNNRPFTEAAFEEDAQRIANLYKSSGRPYVVAEFGRSTWNADHTRITLRYDITEGPDVRFGEILIRGNFKTRDRVILMDLPFKAGDRFDLTKLEEGERNLQTHLIFNSARVQPVGLADGRNPVPILVTVQERYLELGGSLTVAAGAATDRLPYYTYIAAGWIWPNFFGFGSQLELRGDFGFSPDSWGFNLRYTDIRAFGPGWRFDLTGFFRRELTYRLGRIESYGVSIGLARFLTPNLRLFLRYDNYLSQLSVPLLRVDGPNDRQTVNDNTHTAKLTAGLLWDRRVGADNQPNPLMPVRGWLLAGSVGWAFPSSVDNAFVNFFSSENHFVVISGQALGILPFKIRGAQFTLIGNLRYDEGFPIRPGTALPVVERFFAGGDTTTRGYDPDTLKSEIVRSDVGPLADVQAFRVVPQGGNMRILNTIEVQFPIAKTFLGLPWSWVGALFYDMGAVANAPNLLQGSDFKHAVGVSLLRILTPVGPLSLEYAYPITQSLAEERWKTNPWYSHFPGRIHFNWGIPLTRL